MANTTKKTRRVRDEGKYEYAFMLFSQHVSQKEIAKKVNVSEKTITRWVSSDGWVEKRAASNVTRDQLINKTLNLIDSLLSKAIENESDNAAKLADQLSKLAGAIKNLDKQANVVDIVQVFMTFNRWLIKVQNIDDQVTEEIIKVINCYQDRFISERLSHES